MTAVRRAIAAYPTLLRVGLASVIAYRAEFIVWILTTNVPLIQLALWNAVAADGPVGAYGQVEFRAYFLAMLFVRLLTGSWVVWELTMDIRHGALAGRLLRPLHPLFAYSAEHLAAIPFRLLVASPLLVVLWWVAGSAVHVDGPGLGIFALSIIGGWLLLFLTMVLVGSLAFFVDSALGLFELWMGIHALLSGYLLPVELLPGWVEGLARALPFFYMLGFPVEALLGDAPRATMLAHLGIQWLYVAVLLAATQVVWRAGLRRYVAFGG